MASVNKVILVGRVGKDPEIRNIGEDKKVANFSLATSEKYKDQETTEWHNLVIWNKLAEIVEKYVNKGDMLYIEGRIQTRDWTDKDGNKRYTTEIVVSEMKMLSGKKDKPAEPPASDFDHPALPLNEQVDTGTGDDLPFLITIFLTVGSLVQFVL